MKPQRLFLLARNVSNDSTEKRAVNLCSEYIEFPSFVIVFGYREDDYCIKLLICPLYSWDSNFREMKANCETRKKIYQGIGR